MNIQATIIKLLLHYLPEQLLGHIANELKQQAAHYEIVDAPLRADYIRRQAAIILSATNELTALPYVVPVPKS